MHLLRLQVLHKLLNLGSSLVTELLLGRAEHLLENRNDLRSQRLDDGVLRLVKSNNHLKDGLVLLVVLTKRKETDENRKDLVHGDIVGVCLYHAGNAASGIVKESSLLLLVEKRLKLGKNGVVVAENLLVILAHLAKKTGAVGSIATNLRVLITETLEEDLHQASSVRSDGSTHVTDALGNGTDSGTALVLLLSGGVLDADLVKDLVKLTKGLAKRSGKAGDDLHGSLNDKPVVLRGLHVFVALILAIKILLADVLLGKNLKDNLGDEGDGLGVLTKSDGKNGRTAKLESCGNVAVDIGDGSTIV